MRYDCGVAAAVVVVERQVECRSAVDPLWRVLTDTSYLNRLTGEAPRQISTIEGGDGARYRIKTKAGGFWVEWEEWPFEWVHQQRFRVFRKFRAGPVASVDTVLTFAALPEGGARIGIKLELVPKVRWLAWMVRFGTRRAADALALSVRAHRRSAGAPRALAGAGQGQAARGARRARPRATRAARPGELARARRSPV